MKQKYSRLASLSTVIFAGVIASSGISHATTLYWDVNGTGTGFSTVVGAWNGTNAFWNDASTGTGGTVTATTTSADDLIIRQATTNSGSITVSNAPSASSITFAANVGSTANITGSTITIGGTGTSSGIFQQSTGANTVSSGLILRAASTALNFSNSSTGLLTIGAVTGEAASGTQTITVGSGSTGGITLGGIIGDGAAGGKVALNINNSGTGVTILSGANTFTGGVTLTAGTLQIGTTSGTYTSLGDAATSALTINGGSIRLGNNSATITTANNSVWNANFSLLRGTTGTGTWNHQGNVTLGNNVTVTVPSGNNNVVLNVSGDIGETVGGAKSLSFVGTTSITAVLSGTNTYTGGTNASGSATVQFAKTASMSGTGTVAMATGTTLAVNAGGTGEFTNATSGAGSIGGLLAGTGGQGAAVTYAGTARLGIDTTNAAGGSLTYAGNIVNASAGSTTRAISKLGTGTLVLSDSANAFSGGVNLLGGKIVAAAGATTNAFGTGSLTFNTTNTTYGFRTDGASTVSNAWVITGALNRTIEVGRLTSGSGSDVNLTIGSTLNSLDGNSILNFTADTTNISSGTPTITLSGGVRTQDGAQTSSKAVVLDASGVDAKINGINGTGSATRYFILRGSSTGSEVYGAIQQSTGVVTIEKQGAGTWTLSSASNAYTGATIVNAGTLLINGSTSTSSAVTVNAGTLGGTGTIGGTVSVASEATLSPGASIESLKSGALTMASESIFAYEVLDNSTTGADLQAVNGTLSLTNVTLSFDLTTLAALAANSWMVGDTLTLISYKGDAITSGFAGYADDSNHTFGSNVWTFNYNDDAAGNNFGTDAIADGQTNFVTLTALTIVPEPSTALLGALGALALLRRRR